MTTAQRSLVGWRTVLASTLAAVAVGAAVLVPLVRSSGNDGTVAPPPMTTSAGRTRTVGGPPVYAYFYQWFTASSWGRAKRDYPLVGQYSSDDTAILRKQIHEARAAGIDGFLTSWKDTPALDRRLERLVRVASQWHFDLGVVYEALDFARKPLPITTVERDLNLLVSRWGTALGSNYYGRPVIIWTGTNEFSRSDIQSVRTMLGSRATLLAASKDVASYEQIADLVDGEAYYWSSANPATPFTAQKLQQMSAAVHAHDGIWIAPATPGFDGRTLGHSRVIPRDGGATLRRSLDLAYATKPQAIGVISWNEWSENTYIEPGLRYGNEEVDALRGYLAARQENVRSPSAAGAAGWSGLRAASVLGGISLFGVLVAWALSRRRRKLIAARTTPSTNRRRRRLSRHHHRTLRV
jgi:hypothetical protein